MFAGLGCAPASSGQSYDAGAGNDAAVSPPSDAYVPDTCDGGVCGGCASAGTDLIYVVDDTYRLLSFDPRVLSTTPGANPFALIGTLSCDAGWPIDGSSGDAHPFSMSVDRDGNAWVLYNSGEIFLVSTEDASCQATNFQNNNTFDLFGMGFVSNGAGADAETLYIASTSGASKLGTIDRTTLEITQIGTLPDGESNPELTGSGAGELYGYYPGRFDTWVSMLDQSSAGSQQTWELDPLGGVNNLRAWAFAHWGGKFYVFVTWIDPFDRERSDVVELDQQTGTRRSVVNFQDLGIDYIIVGAGVSTCAPFVVP